MDSHQVVDTTPGQRSATLVMFLSMRQSRPPTGMLTFRRKVQVVTVASRQISCPLQKASGRAARRTWGKQNAGHPQRPDLEGDDNEAAPRRAWNSGKCSGACGLSPPTGLTAGAPRRCATPRPRFLMPGAWSPPCEGSHGNKPPAPARVVVWRSSCLCCLLCLASFGAGPRFTAWEDAKRCAQKKKKKKKKKKKTSNRLGRSAARKARGGTEASAGKRPRKHATVRKARARAKRRPAGWTPRRVGELRRGGPTTGAATQRQQSGAVPQGRGATGRAPSGDQGRTPRNQSARRLHRRGRRAAVGQGQQAQGSAFPCAGARLRARHHRAQQRVAAGGHSGAEAKPA